MQVQSSSNQSFQANILRNKSFVNVVKYAKDNNCLMTLDGSLHALSKANKGTVCIVDGRTPKGDIFSTLMLGKKAVPNAVGDAKSPAEASYNALIELSFIGGKKFRELFGKNVEKNVTEQGILKDYSVLG